MGRVARLLERLGILATDHEAEYLTWADARLDELALEARLVGRPVPASPDQGGDVHPLADTEPYGRSGVLQDSPERLVDWDRALEGDFDLLVDLQ